MFCPFFTEAFAEFLWNLDNFGSFLVFDCPVCCTRDKLAVQFVHLYHFERSVEVFELQTMEVGGTFAGCFQQTLYGASIDFTDVCCRFNRTAMAKAFDNAYHIHCGQLGVLHE